MAIFRNKIFQTKVLVITLMIGLLTPLLLHAENKELSLDEIFNLEIPESNISGGKSRKVNQSANIITVLGKKELRRIGVTNIFEALQAVPGLHMSTGLQSPRNPLFSFRGFFKSSPARCLVLFNGVPINRVFFHNPAISDEYPIELIEKIEVIRGPGSAIYGANAFTGVINIITKNIDTIDENEFGLTYGSFDTKKSWVVYKKELSSFELSLTSSYLMTQGARNSIAQDGQWLIDPSLSSAPGYLNTNKEEGAFTAFVKKKNTKLMIDFNESQTDTFEGINMILNPEGNIQYTRGILSLERDKIPLFGNWEGKWKLGYRYAKVDATKQLLYAAGTNFGSGPFPDGVISEYATEEQKGEGSFYLQNTFGSHYITSGISYTYENLTPSEKRNFGPGLTPIGSIVDISDDPSQIFMSGGYRTNIGLFTQDDWQLNPAVTLVGGVRYDKYNDFGDIVNPRGSMIWSISENFVSRIMYAEAFRAPAFSETRIKNNSLRLGNPDLKPETISTLELAFDYTKENRSRLTLNLFQNNLKDVVAQPGVQIGNYDKQESIGGELEYEVLINPHFKILTNYSHQIAKVKKTGEKLGLAPEHQAYFEVSWFNNNTWEMGTQVHYFGKSLREEGDDREPIKAKTQVNLKVIKKINKSFQASITGKNIFNETLVAPSQKAGAASLPQDLALPKANYYLNFTYTF